MVPCWSKSKTTWWWQNVNMCKDVNYYVKDDVKNDWHIVCFWKSFRRKLNWEWESWFWRCFSCCVFRAVSQEKIHKFMLTLLLFTGNSLFCHECVGDSNACARENLSKEHKKMCRPLTDIEEVTEMRALCLKVVFKSNCRFKIEIYVKIID